MQQPCFDLHDQDEAYLSIAPTMDEIKPTDSANSVHDLEQMVSFFFTQLSIVDETSEEVLHNPGKLGQTAGAGHGSR